MMKFTAYGHPNITARHKTTLEFTKDKELSLRGDCIVGVKADFSLSEIKKFIKSLKTNKIKIIIETNIKNSILKKPMKIKDTVTIVPVPPWDFQAFEQSSKTIKGKRNKKIREVIHAEINPDFNSDREMVIRKSDFRDDRTFAVRVDKGAKELKRELIEYLRERDCIVEVSII